MYRHLDVIHYLAVFVTENHANSEHFHPVVDPPDIRNTATDFLVAELHIAWIVRNAILILNHHHLLPHHQLSQRLHHLNQV